MTDNGDEVCPRAHGSGERRHVWDGPYMNRPSRCYRCGVERTYAESRPDDR